MEYKPGDIVVPILSGQEQTTPQELIQIHTKDSKIVYELADDKIYPAAIPGNKLTWALVTLRHGYSVVPVEAGGKKPLIKWKSYQQKKPTEDELKAWWSQWPDANLAIICGEISSIIVLDVDGPDGERYIKTHGLPESPTASTGKGRHIYLKHPGYKVGNFARKVPGLDLRGDGGYVVAPESWHSGQSKHYRWLKDPWTTELADAPLWLLELLKEPNNTASHTNEPYIEAALSDELARLARAQQGHRNDQLNTSAFSLGQLVGAGELSKADVSRSLLAIATAIGLSEKEARATIQSGLASGMQQPRDIPENDYDELPPLPDQDTLETKYDELKNAPESSRAERFREMSSLLAAADPFTAEAYIDRIAQNRIATKTITRKAIKDNTKKQNKQQRPNPTHDELGDRWVSQHSGLTIFVYEKWYRYKNGVWKPTNQVDSEVWDILIFAKSEGVRPTKAIKISVLDYMQNQCRKADETMNSSPHLICMQNGVFNLEKLELVDYDPAHYMTSKLEFGYDPTAECPLWQETILDWMSNNEPGVRHLQEAVGYSLTSDTKYQMAWMLAGEGSNGKDTFLELLRCLVGDAHHELDLSALSVNERYGLANLPGKKLVTCAEAVSDRPVADTYFKKLISGEPMEARAPYGKPFNFRPICKIWWSVNDKPLVTDQTRGYWRRWTVVPFLESYLGREDFDLEDKLKKELPGIFNWAIKGLERLRKTDRLTSVPEFVDATEEYRHKTSVESLFVDEACIIDLQAETPIKEIYASYKTYCSENGYHYKGKRRFSDDMVRIGYERSRMSGGTRCFIGLTVKDQLQWD